MEKQGANANGIKQLHALIDTVLQPNCTVNSTTTIDLNVYIDLREKYDKRHLLCGARKSCKGIPEQQRRHASR